MRYHVSPKLIAAFIDVEWRCSRRAVSAMGGDKLIQLMPATRSDLALLSPMMWNGALLRAPVTSWS